MTNTAGWCKQYNNNDNNDNNNNNNNNNSDNYNNKKFKVTVQDLRL